MGKNIPGVRMPWEVMDEALLEDHQPPAGLQGYINLPYTEQLKYHQTVLEEVAALWNYNLAGGVASGTRTIM